MNKFFSAIKRFVDAVIEYAAAGCQAVKTATVAAYARVRGFSVSLVQFHAGLVRNAWRVCRVSAELLRAVMVKNYGYYATMFDPRAALDMLGNVLCLATLGLAIATCVRMYQVVPYGMVKMLPWTSTLALTYYGAIVYGGFAAVVAAWLLRKVLHQAIVVATLAVMRADKAFVRQVRTDTLTQAATRSANVTSALMRTITSNFLGQNLNAFFDEHEKLKSKPVAAAV